MKNTIQTIRIVAVQIVIIVDKSLFTKDDFYPELISTEESLGNKLKIYNDVIDSFSTIYGKNPTDINNQK